MLSPSSSLPASVICGPLTVTSRRTSFRQSESRVEAPLRYPCESGLMTTVIANGATFACFEKKVPDHVPVKSVAVLCAELDGLFYSFAARRAHNGGRPRVPPKNSNER